MKRAGGTTRGLEYLHDKYFKSLTYFLIKDIIKSSRILALQKLVELARTHISTKVMGTSVYCGLEYALLGHLTIKFDVYSFGVVLHKLILSKVLII